MITSPSVRDLRDAGLLHKKLLTRTRLLVCISTVLLLIEIYQTIHYGFSFWILDAVIIIGFLLGLFVFSKMNKAVWNREEEVIQAGRMDVFGAAILILYIVFEVSLRSLLKAEFGTSTQATTYLLAAIGASLLGRSIGTLLSFRKLAVREGIGQNLS